DGPAGLAAHVVCHVPPIEPAHLLAERFTEGAERQGVQVELPEDGRLVEPEEVGDLLLLVLGQRLAVAAHAVGGAEVAQGLDLVGGRLAAAGAVQGQGEGGRQQADGQGAGGAEGHGAVPGPNWLWNRFNASTYFSGRKSTGLSRRSRRAPSSRNTTP